MFAAWLPCTQMGGPHTTGGRTGAAPATRPAPG